MKTRFFVSLSFILPLAGTLVRCVPSPRTPSLARTGSNSVQRRALAVQLKRTRQLFEAGEFQAGAQLATQARAAALAAGEVQIAAYFLGNSGGCHFALHQYREALSDYLEARRLAESIHDNATAGSLDINIASLYSQLGQLDAATTSIDRAKARLSGAERIRRLPVLLTLLASLDAQHHRIPQALALYREAIQAAARAGDPENYALAWNDLGYMYLDEGQWKSAEGALLEAYRVRKLNHLRSIESTIRNLGRLRFEQGQLQIASGLLDEAVALSAAPGGLNPAWQVHLVRGKLRLASGRVADALDDLRIAERLAAHWYRRSQLDNATRITAENKISEVYSAVVSASSSLYFSTGRSSFAQEAFEAAETNRAASLRAGLRQPVDWRRRLSAEYWETLRKLENAEAEAPLSPGAAATARVTRLRGELIEFESRAGIENPVPETGFRQHAQRVLGPDTALFTFHLAAPHSYLWALSDAGFALYRLPPGSEIESLTARFNRELRTQDPAWKGTGERLFQVLFGQTATVYRHKPRWLLAPDSKLFELPFAALVEKNGLKSIPLVERHSIQIVSGAGSLSKRDLEAQASGPFVGIADPVYNMADSRWAGPAQTSFRIFFTAFAGTVTDGSLQLARLPASAREVSDCARTWSGPARPITLEGAAACRARLEDALRLHPAVLHFATHIVGVPAGSSIPSGGSRIVLSLNSQGQYEFIGPAEIATWNLRGSVVALSGCSSGTAEVLPASGLMGLTRASQVAGASAVIASRWPTPDDAGAFFNAFYKYLRNMPQAGPAGALQRAQLEMLRSGTWRASPFYWAAYFVTGNLT